MNSWNNQNGRMKLAKYLRIWSYSLLYTSPFCILLFLSRKIPHICLYTYPLSSMALVAPKIFLTFFEIARLKLCFYSNKIPSELAYPKFLFTFLYSIGWILLLTSISYLWFTAEIYELDPLNMGCSYDSNNLWSFISTLLVIVLATWNWTIIGLYTFKLYQLKKSIISKDEKSKHCLQKINLVLSKMLFLILIIQIIANSIGLLIIWYSDAQWQIGWMIDFITVISVMYLMLEHNQSDYYKFIGFFIKIKCIKYCCCCIKNMIEEDKINEINKQNRRNRDDESSSTDLHEIETTTNALDIVSMDIDDGTSINREITENQELEINSDKIRVVEMKYVDKTETSKTIQIDEYRETSTRL